MLPSFGAKPMSGLIIVRNCTTRILRLVLMDALIVLTKTDIQIASLCKPPITGASPSLIAQGRGYGLPQWIITIHVEAPRLTVFAAIMSNGADKHLTQLLCLPTDLKSMSANIANIVSLNSCQSSITREVQSRNSGTELRHHRIAHRRI